MVAKFDGIISLRLDYAQMMAEEGEPIRRKAGRIFKGRIERQIFELEETINKAEKALEELRDE